MIHHTFSNVFYLTVRLSSRQCLNLGMHLKAGIQLAQNLMVSCKLAEEEGNQSGNVQTMAATADSVVLKTGLESKLIIRF